MKRYLALARVSSREQEREGFSLDVQEEALRRHAKRQGGEIVRLYRIAETASKKDERKTFKTLIADAKKHAHELDGILFYKIDRAARNLYDYLELERIESEYGVPFISVSQPTERNPAGRMQRRMLANIANFYTEQQSVDVKEGHKKRVENGHFVTRPPIGYKNIRENGKAKAVVHPENARKVRRIFELYAYHGQTLDSLNGKLRDEGITYMASQPHWTRSHLYKILTDRSYIGDVKYQGNWYPGVHEPLIDKPTRDRVQVLLGGSVYRSHEMTYAGSLVKCGHCGSPITGEVKTKMTKQGETEYVYYRCCRYNKEGHPRVRLRESELDAQVLALFDRMRIDAEDIRDWVVQVLRAKVQHVQREARARQEVLERDLKLVTQQQERLLNLRLLDEINTDTYSRKSVELRDREAELRLAAEACSRNRHEEADIAVQAFELSQKLREKWVTADYAAKRRILEILCLNLRLDGATLVATMRKPFDVLAERLISENSRGERI
jgi:DNA invertase Pin-like site-specific DNA recombinase